MFFGDSIVEASNSGLKGGNVTISTNMNIDTSAFTQVQIGKTQTRKKHNGFYMSFLRTMLSLIDTDNLWSDSLTKDILTVYAEDLACKRFDKKTIYNVSCYNIYMLYVLKKSTGEEGEPTSKISCFFD